MSGTTGTSRESQRSRYIKLLYWVLSFMVLSPGSHIAINCTSWSVSISAACTPPSKYVGMNVKNSKVLDIAEVTSIEAMLLKIWLHWAGHVSRMEDHFLAKPLLYGELPMGYHKRGTPWKTYKDSQENPHLLWHWPLAVGETSCWPRDMVANNTPGGLPLWRQSKN